ncbi:TraB/GumN family protein [Qipengyuania sp.]|uniref:TraB/GumN family protein n=1 Tax=Qipengyuania sp. TaxID=2004515 RepID=UPI0035C7BB5C
MKNVSRKLALLLAGPLLALPGCAGMADTQTASTATTAAAEHPALWKVADEDTTIYLFGTIHALPDGIEWYEGPVATALSSASELVTEIPHGAMADPATQARFQQSAALPEGENLRDKLNAEQRAVYEAAMSKAGLPAAAFDRMKPWFAAVTLGVIPVIKAGYSMEAGVENAVETQAAATMKRSALESVDDQLAAFNGLPMRSQIDYLVQVAGQIDEVVPMMNDMVALWSKGDAAGLAALLNDEIDDPALAEALLYKRNRNWAEWIDDRLDRPGTVFIAVGAGHLAGTNSVQDYLSEDGIESRRVQ